MAQARRKFDEDFKQGAVRLVRETGKPIAQVARDLGVKDLSEIQHVAGGDLPCVVGQSWCGEIPSGTA